MRLVHWVRLLGSLAVIVLCGACHSEVQEAKLESRLVGISDRFFDVKAIGAERAVIVGYAGKVLITADGGFTWTQATTGTRRALYRVQFVDASTGWISGQEGLILRTVDGGETWQRQRSGTDVNLFSLFFLDAKNGWAVGDKSILLDTHDGGATWTLHKIVSAAEKQLSAQEALASADPVLYDVYFLNPTTGWVVGEFGKIFHTTDGGRSWVEQQQSLLGAEVVDLLDLPTLFGVRFLNVREGIAVGLDGKIARTEDGVTWKFAPMQLEYPVVDPLFYPTVFPDGTGWAVGAAGEVLRVDGPGRPWERIDLGVGIPTWLRGMSWADETNGWIVGGFGRILHTKDGGKTWIPSLG